MSGGRTLKELETLLGEKVMESLSDAPSAPTPKSGHCEQQETCSLSHGLVCIPRSKPLAKQI